MVRTRCPHVRARGADTGHQGARRLSLGFHALREATDPGEAVHGAADAGVGSHGEVAVVKVRVGSDIDGVGEEETRRGGANK